MWKAIRPVGFEKIEWRYSDVLVDGRMNIKVHSCIIYVFVQIVILIIFGSTKFIEQTDKSTKI